MNKNSQSQQYAIWIEAEQWAPGEWTPTDDNSDVIITFEDGKHWVATFYSYQNISSLTKKYQEQGDCLSGKYFVATDMILVDEVSRERIEEVVIDLLKENEFETYFTSCEGS